jgi:hypothetical protein
MEGNGKRWWGAVDKVVVVVRLRMCERECKGNLAVLRLITQASKGESKENTLRKPC